MFPRLTPWTGFFAMLAMAGDPTTREGQYGRIETERTAYGPLELVRVTVTGRAKGDATCRVKVADPEQRIYFEKDVDLASGRGAVQFPATGALGAHYVYLWFPGEKRYSRYVNFRLDAETEIETGDRDFDTLYPFTRDAMLLGRRDYETRRGRFVGYISGDTWHFDGIWLRDWIYSLPAYKYWEREMQCGLDRFLEVQREDGQTPDGIERDGRTWRVGLESDVEYILTLGVWDTWRATGDDAWMKRALPKLERAMAYIRSDPKHWDATNRLIKRQHSCDTWDYDIDGATDKGATRHVVATCDQSGYALAFRALSEMYAQAGDREAAARWAKEAAEYRERAVKLLWDGGKFLHHVHLEKIDHGDFDESKQLAMGNTWAVTRGLADERQARSIVDEYRRRHRATGDKFPWWSLQPGYPDHLGYWKDAYRKQGAYANGGLMPWVGGELSRGALQNGRAEYGVELLRQYARHLRETGGAQVWYWPDGTPGFRTTNEVRYAGWGMAQWVDALVEGLAGIGDVAGRMRKVVVAPRWAAAGVARARAVARYAASGGYFAYEWRAEGRSLSLDYSGSGTRTEFRVLLPKGFAPRAVMREGTDIEFAVEETGEEVYVKFAPEQAQRGSIRIAAQ
jgi:hypothetical protein